MFAVIFETSSLTKTLYTGTIDQCKHFMRNNKHICGDDAFLQELDLCEA